MSGSLFKYLPRRFADRLVKRGDVMFRTLSYFRALEHGAQGDQVEGIHIDAPDQPPTLHNFTTGVQMTGPWGFLNSINQSRVYAWCCSTSLSLELFEAFDADACVEITDPTAFFLHCQTAARLAFRIERPVLRHRRVEYWTPNREAPLNIKDPINIPFLKHDLFAPQAEYRAAFAISGGEALEQRVVLGHFDLAAEIADAPIAEKLLAVGKLTHVARVLTVDALTGRAT